MLILFTVGAKKKRKKKIPSDVKKDKNEKERRLWHQPAVDVKFEISIKKGDLKGKCINKKNVKEFLNFLERKIEKERKKFVIMKLFFTFNVRKWRKFYCKVNRVKAL